MLPDDNNLPDNFYAVKKSLDKLSMPSKRIDACKNHCMLFYGEEDKDLTHCHWCNESRYKSDQQNIPNLIWYGDGMAIEEVPYNIDDGTNDNDVEEDKFEDIISDDNDDDDEEYDEFENILSDYCFLACISSFCKALIIMSSGRRRSGPRPSHGDISGNGAAGQMLLDNHHIDDDNDEGVDVTQPGVEASNAMRGSNIPNPLPELADRPMISICADEFDDQKSVGHSITSILQFRFSEPWATWSCVPRDKQDQMWLRFTVCLYIQT
ncbi:hypothetical protein Tco_0030437 [Tanacetum coccineum]